MGGWMEGHGRRLETGSVSLALALAGSRGQGWVDGGMAATVTGLRGAGLGLGRLAWIGMGGWRDGGDRYWPVGRWAWPWQARVDRDVCRWQNCSKTRQRPQNFSASGGVASGGACGGPLLAKSEISARSAT